MKYILCKANPGTLQNRRHSHFANEMQIAIHSICNSFPRLPQIMSLSSDKSLAREHSANQNANCVLTSHYLRRTEDAAADARPKTKASGCWNTMPVCHGLLGAAGERWEGWSALRGIAGVTVWCRPWIGPGKRGKWVGCTLEMQGLIRFRVCYAFNWRSLRKDWVLGGGGARGFKNLMTSQCRIIWLYPF